MISVSSHSARPDGASELQEVVECVWHEEGHFSESSSVTDESHSHRQELFLLVSKAASSVM